MSDINLSCREENRREKVREAALFGLDYVEVSDDQRTLSVYCLGKAPQGIEADNLQLSGGRRIRDVQITGFRVLRQSDPTLDDVLEVKVNKPGDFSTYTLSVIQLDGQGHPDGQPMAGFDEGYASVTFSFKAGCPSDLDCKPSHVCPPPERPEPEINYLAKDYESFRQLILDRLALIMPAWQETHVPDLGIALVELLAYTGDYLSYYQDAVATEAYLATARQRISVRRHARLVDYPMHDGCNARAWITIATDTDLQLDLTQIYFVTAFPGSADVHVLGEAALSGLAASTYDVFEPLWANGGSLLSVWKAHSEIYFYTWGECECCLTQGATSATLTDAWIPASTGGDPASGGSQPGTSSGTAAPASKRAATASAVSNVAGDPPGTVRALHLRVGDVLIFEEVLGPKTGNPADANPLRRQAVRLTKVTQAVDPLYSSEQYPNSGQPVVEIEWAPEDSLSFTMCISSREPYPDCTCMQNVSVARGNVVLVDHGSRASEETGIVPTESTTPRCSCDCEPSQFEIVSGCYGPKLSGVPLTFSQPLPPPCSGLDLLQQDARQALPWITLVSIPAGVCPGSQAASSTGGTTAKNKSAPQELQTPCQVPPLFTFADVANPESLAAELVHPSEPGLQLLASQLSASTRQLLAAYDVTRPFPSQGAALMSDLTGLLETWTPQRDLLESGPDDLHFVVEMDDDGVAHLRFGDGALGRQPDAGTAFRADYRVGNGTAGNVGAETITYLITRAGSSISGAVLNPRNPQPAVGGTDPEPVSEVKLLAPYAFRSVLERAITPSDYATIAQDNMRRWEARAQLAALDPSVCAAPFQKLQGAKAALRWTGSWYTVLVALDPSGSEDANPELVEEVTAFLAPFRRMGYDLLVAPAQYVPLSVGVRVCVLPNYLQAHVESAVLDVLSNRVLPNGQLGFFHPDNLTFGEGILLSKLVAAVEAVPGVQDVAVTELERFEVSEPPAGSDEAGEELPSGSILQLGPLEIARLDNDPNFPENGRLVLEMRGGR
jgi:hypothetical protein